ncbi:hypothetical protein NIES4073_14120 [Kalymmatonema gypsitolerans NIES-4073]|jgi:hypothetical protein|nr:hypothetical protein SAMD00079811_02810 [Scytonema sp. HK-05]BAZ20536.1 hypothetical protein NIES4073_14120 [Scytonema sp. NIES-4073]
MPYKPHTKAFSYNEKTRIRVARMRVAAVLFAMSLALTPATVLAQPKTTGSDQEKILRTRINQQIQSFNVNLKDELKETQDLKRFSRPYTLEFQRRNEQMQHRRDIFNLGIQKGQNFR